METKVEIVETQGNQPAPEPQKVAPATPVKTEEPKYVRIEDLEKVNQSIANTRDYHNRRFNEVLEKLEKLTPKPVEKVPDDLDKIVQENWQAGVEGVVERVLTRREVKTQAETQTQFESRIRQESINKLMERHKELADPNSEKSLEVKKILEEHPDYVNNPRGPLLTAYELENRLQARGNINNGGENKVNKEVRARAAGIPAGTSPANKGNYSLSKQDMDFCRLNGINPENYKRNKSLREVQA